MNFFCAATFLQSGFKLSVFLWVKSPEPQSDSLDKYSFLLKTANLGSTPSDTRRRQKTSLGLPIDQFTKPKVKKTHWDPGSEPVFSRSGLLVG